MESEKSFKDSRSNKAILPQVFILTKTIGKIMQESEIHTANTSKLTTSVYENA